MAVSDGVPAFMDDALFLFEKNWRPDVMEEDFRMGAITNGLLMPNKKETVGQDGVHIHSKLTHAFNVTSSRNPNGDGPTSVAVPTGRNIHYKFRPDATDNDFMTMHGANEFRYTDIVQRAGQYAATGDENFVRDFAAEEAEQTMDVFTFYLALHRSIRRDAILCQQNGVGKQDDNENYTAATATPAAGTGARIKIDGGSIALFQEGMRVIPYSSGTRQYVGVLEVRGINYDDESIGLWDVDNPTTADYSAVGLADNIDLVLAGPDGTTMYNTGMYGPAEWMSTPVSGESFLRDSDTGTAIDRTTRDGRFLSVNRIREGQSAAQIHPDHMLAAGTAMGLRSDNAMYKGCVATLHPRLHDTLRQRLGEEAFITVPSTESSAARALNLGSQKVFYQHPVLGQIALLADPMQKPDALWLRQTQDWISLFPLGAAPRIWSRRDLGGYYFKQGDTVGGPISKMLRRDMMLVVGDYCYKPKNQAAVLNLTA